MFVHQPTHTHPHTHTHTHTHTHNTSGARASRHETKAERACWPCHSWRIERTMLSRLALSSATASTKVFQAAARLRCVGRRRVGFGV